MAFCNIKYDNFAGIDIVISVVIGYGFLSHYQSTKKRKNQMTLKIKPTIAQYPHHKTFALSDEQQDHLKALASEHDTNESVIIRALIDASIATRG